MCLTMEFHLDFSKRFPKIPVILVFGSSLCIDNEIEGVITMEFHLDFSKRFPKIHVILVFGSSLCIENEIEGVM